MGQALAQMRPVTSTKNPHGCPAQNHRLSSTSPVTSFITCAKHHLRCSCFHLLQQLHTTQESYLPIQTVPWWQGLFNSLSVLQISQNQRWGSWHWVRQRLVWKRRPHALDLWRAWTKVPETPSSLRFPITSSIWDLCEMQPCYIHLASPG